MRQRAVVARQLRVRGLIPRVDRQGVEQARRGGAVGDREGVASRAPATCSMMIDVSLSATRTLAVEREGMLVRTRSAQHRRAEVFRDRIHDYYVRPPALTHHRAAADADAAKARALVRGQPGHVPLQRHEQHIAQLQHMEREVENEPRGLGAEALAATLAERDGEFGSPVGVDDVEQPGGADRRGVGAVLDRELDRLRLALRAALEVVLHPLLLALRSGDAPAARGRVEPRTDSSSGRRRRRGPAGADLARPSRR